MKEFEKELIKAKHESKKKLLNMSIILLLLLFVTIIFLMSSKSFHLEINPTDTVNLKINITKGHGLILKNRYFPVGKPGEVVVKADGFEDEYIDLSKIDSYHVPVNLKFKPINLKIESLEVLENPKWFINSNFFSSKSFFDGSFEPGNYEIKVISDFHDDEVIDVVLNRGQNKKINISPSLSEVNLSINVIPSNSILKLNNILQENIPTSITLNAGKHSLEIKNKNYEDLQDILILTNKQYLYEREYSLISKKKQIPISLYPAGGVLRVNGELVRSIDKVNLNLVGNNSIHYSLEGFKSKILSIKGAPKKINLQLEPIFGEIYLTSTPEADVYLDNNYIGVTPIRDKFLSKDYLVEFKSEGYVTKKISIKPTDKFLTKYSANLESIKDKKLRLSKSQYKNSVGIMMQRFSPDKFIMGSRGTEKNRRSDEFQRKIKFTKHFYISQTEITNQQYALFKKGYPKDNFPISNISWEEAALFCNWLSKKEGFKEVYKFRNGSYIGANFTADGYRLPTEAEWEYVAKKANKINMTTFVWGDREETKYFVGNLADESSSGNAKVYIPGYNDKHKSKAPVSFYNAEPSGLYDQSGNVSEWVHDFYSFNPPSVDIIYEDYSGPVSSSDHIIKGSNYLSHSFTEIRASYKASSPEKSELVGFRIARYVY